LAAEEEMTLIDSNVLIDLLSANQDWLAWSREQLAQRSEAGPLLINEIVYAELSAQSISEHDLDRALDDLGLIFERIPKSALFLAGQAFARYRKSGGVRTGVLPDFFLGAHAQAAGLPLLTRDTGRYRTYFPKVKLIAP
jgi:predicted nucleic acid-binding protein